MKLVVIIDTGEQVEARCDRCRHWDLEAEWFVDSEGELIKEQAVIGFHGRCNAVPRVYDRPDPQMEPRHPFIECDSPQEAILYTPPEHFCGLLERKEPA